MLIGGGGDNQQENEYLLKAIRIHEANPEDSHLAEEVVHRPPMFDQGNLREPTSLALDILRALLVLADRIRREADHILAAAGQGNPQWTVAVHILAEEDKRPGHLQ